MPDTSSPPPKEFSVYQVLRLQDLDTDNGPDEEGIVAASSMSVALGCESNTSVIVC